MTKLEKLQQRRENCRRSIDQIELRITKLQFYRSNLYLSLQNIEEELKQAQNPAPVPPPISEEEKKKQSAEALARQDQEFLEFLRKSKYTSAQKEKLLQTMDLLKNSHS